MKEKVAKNKNWEK